MSPIPYVKEPIQLTPEQLGKLKVEVLPTEDDKWELIRVSGPCPRCDDRTTHEHPREVAEAEATQAGKWRKEFTMPCACGVSHAEKETACGRFWNLVVEW